MPKDMGRIWSKIGRDSEAASLNMNLKEKRNVMLLEWQCDWKTLIIDTLIQYDFYCIANMSIRVDVKSMGPFQSTCVDTCIISTFPVHSSPLNQVSFGSGNGLSPVQRQAITWTNADLLSIGIKHECYLITIQKFSLMKIHLKMLFATWQPFCPRGAELINSSHKFV